MYCDPFFFFGGTHPKPKAYVKTTLIISLHSCIQIILLTYIITLLIMVIRRVTCLNIETGIFGETIIVNQIVIQMGKTFIYISKNMKV